MRWQSVILWWERVRYPVRTVAHIPPVTVELYGRTLLDYWDDYKAGDITKRQYEAINLLFAKVKTNRLSADEVNRYFTVIMAERNA